MSENTNLTVVDFSPTFEVPDKAPTMPIDTSNPNISFDDLFPENFFSMDALQHWLAERGAESRALTVTGASMELLYDPSNEKPEDGRWLPCLSFAETTTKLVINKTRGNQLRKLTGSPLLAKWADVGPICLAVGVDGGKAMICIKRLPEGETLDDFNASLFGENP